MRTLLIDNYDSYTFNLFHLLGQVNGEEPVVVANDERPWEELDELGFDLRMGAWQARLEALAEPVDASVHAAGDVGG